MEMPVMIIPLVIFLLKKLQYIDKMILLLVTMVVVMRKTSMMMASMMMRPE
jgi:hypothetical protein